ncbi:uncharacterized protein [Patagioenas fasciata]|uniref:uncharacterized protein n=1 Tax=Patagioenas fasciata TaxID=372321 RepID=UPI0032E92AF2
MSKKEITELTATYLLLTIRVATEQPSSAATTKEADEATFRGSSFVTTGLNRRLGRGATPGHRLPAGAAPTIPRQRNGDPHPRPPLGPFPVVSPGGRARRAPFGFARARPARLEATGPAQPARGLPPTRAHLAAALRRRRGEAGGRAAEPAERRQPGQPAPGAAPSGTERKGAAEQSRLCSCAPGHSELKKHLELCHGSCCVLRFFAAAPVGEADPGSRLGSRTEPPGHAVDDPEGWTFPAPRQRAGLRPGWRPRGLPRPMHEAEEAKTTPEPSEVMKQLLDELRRAQETNRKAVQKEVFPEGSRSSLPGSGEAAEAMPAAGMPGLPRPRGYQPSSLNEFRWTNSDVVGESTTGAPNPQGSASVSGPDVMRKFSTISRIIAASTVPLALLLIFLMVWKCRKAKKLHDADREAGREKGGCPLFCGRRTRRCSFPESYIQQQLPLFDPGNLECPLSPQSSQSSSPYPAAPQWWDQPSGLLDQPESEPECPASPESPRLPELSPSPLQQQDENNGTQKTESKPVLPPSPQPGCLPNLSSEAPQQQKKPSVLKRLSCCK